VCVGIYSVVIEKGFSSINARKRFSPTALFPYIDVEERSVSTPQIIPSLVWRIIVISGPFEKRGPGNVTHFFFEFPQDFRSLIDKVISGKWLPYVTPCCFCLGTSQGHYYKVHFPVVGARTLR